MSATFACWSCGTATFFCNGDGGCCARCDHSAHATPAPPLSPTEAAIVARFEAAPDALRCPVSGEDACTSMVPCEGCPAGES